jgi:two-component system alkaline phosphatase synthesis response regulator PhoP
MSKVLIVEDEQSLQFLYKTKLELSRFHVETADNGEDGLMKARDFMPDIILLDLLMPKMNGAEMLKNLREQDWGANIRVIILTNISKDEAPHVLRFLSVDRYIVKAYYTPAQVVDVVKEVLSIR